MGNEEVKLMGTVWMKTKVDTSGGGVRMEIITIEGYYFRFQIFVSLQQKRRSNIKMKKLELREFSKNFIKIWTTKNILLYQSYTAKNDLLYEMRKCVFY